MGYNVLFIIADDLNDWLGCYDGHPNTKTPNIDAFAENAVRFTCAYASTPLCNPARTALLTGKAPWNTGIYNNQIWFRDVPDLSKTVTLPQSFKNQGYFTASAGKVFHRDCDVDDPPSWSKYCGHWGGGGKPHPDNMLKHGIHHKLYSRYFREYLDFYPSETSVLETGDWHNAKWVANMVRNRKDQFFIAYGACKPHLPWYVPQEYFDMHPLDSIKLPPIKKSRYGAYELKQPEHPDKDNDNRRSPFKVLRAHNKLHEAIQGYLAAVSYTDDCFGQIINMLDTDREKREKTIVIVTSDHGYQLGEQKTWAKYNQWQRANRIPLLIRVPGLNPGVCHEPVSSLDIYPTLMDLCGLTAPHELDGNNLKSLLYNVYQDQNRIVHMSSTDGSSYSISRDKRYYYVNVKDGSDKLYDMYEDENQWRNVANRDENVSIVERFKKEIPDFVEPILPFKLDQLKLDHNLKKERESLIQKMKRNRKIGI